MLYEVRTYRLKPRSQNEVIKRFGEAYEDRKQHSEISAFFYSDIGPLNEIIHIWPYKDLADRTEIRAKAAASPNWPPHISEFLDEQLSGNLSAEQRSSETNRYNNAESQNPVDKAFDELMANK